MPKSLFHKKNAETIHENVSATSLCYLMFSHAFQTVPELFVLFQSNSHYKFEIFFEEEKKP
jgi:hypothetical protein